MSHRLRFLLLGLGALGAGCAALTLLFLRTGGRLNIEPAFVAAFVVLGLLWIFAGLVAWWKRPENRTGALMTAAGFLIFTGLSGGWDASLPSTVFGITDRLFLAVAVHLFVAFPRGRLSSTIERVLVAAVYVVVLLMAGVGVQLFLGPEDSFSATGPRNLLLVHDDRGLAEAIELAADLALAVLCVAAVALLAHRWLTSSGPARRVLAPVLWSGVLVLVFVAALLTHWPSYETSDGFFLWAFLVAGGIVPLAFLTGLLRTRLHRSAVAELVVELGSSPPTAHVRDAIAHTLGDESLELAFWLPADNRYVDPEGQALDPEGEPGRAVTVLEPAGKRVAALVHDPSLLDDPELLEAVGAAASLALENSRLQAELRAQLAEVRASRTRIVEAGDAERRRLERDLHDGAQQRLLGIRLALQLASGRLADGGASVGDLLAEADAEVVGALEELRALARGIHPAILTEEGLAPALAALARRAPIPVELTVCRERLPVPVEATAYFVAGEALANVVKHAHASRATIGVTRANGRVTIEVADDGVGGVDAGGTGLRGLRDRVEALDGRLRVESPAVGGTRITAAIPCA
jgi:signal transduction histidine kinase